MYNLIPWATNRRVPSDPGAADKGLYWNSLPFGEFLWIRMGIHLISESTRILQIVLNSVYYRIVIMLEESGGGGTFF